MEVERLPVDDPYVSLPETAKRILAAAARVVLRDGARGLTLSRIERESGENRALIAYHFGNKHGLEAALIDAVFHAACLAIIERLRAFPTGTERVRATGFDLAHRAADTDAYRVFYQILPLAFDNDDLAIRVANVYQWYRKLFAKALVDSGFRFDSAPHPYGALVAAVADGLSIQLALDPEGFDLDAAVQAWAELLATHAASVERDTADDDTPSDIHDPS